MPYPIIDGSFFIVRENGILLYTRNEWIFMKLKIWLGRIIPLVIIALGEIVLYCNLFKWLTTSFVFIEIVLHILSILIVLNIVRTSRHLSSDLMWIILIMLFPVFGTFVYVLMLLSLLFGKTFRNIIKEQKRHLATIYKMNRLLMKFVTIIQTMSHSLLSYMKRASLFIEIRILNIMHPVKMDLMSC